MEEWVVQIRNPGSLPFANKVKKYKAPEAILPRCTSSSGGGNLWKVARAHGKETQNAIELARTARRGLSRPHFILVIFSHASAERLAADATTPAPTRVTMNAMGPNTGTKNDPRLIRTTKSAAR
jgi:hypothetical protein